MGMSCVLWAPVNMLSKATRVLLTSLREDFGWCCVEHPQSNIPNLADTVLSLYAFGMKFIFAVREVVASFLFLLWCGSSREGLGVIPPTVLFTT